MNHLKSPWSQLGILGARRKVTVCLAPRFLEHLHVLKKKDNYVKRTTPIINKLLLCKSFESSKVPCVKRTTPIINKLLLCESFESSKVTFAFSESLEKLMIGDPFPRNLYVK